MANDTFELTSNLVKGLTEKENAAKRNDMRIYKGPQQEYSISPLYQRYIGDTVTVASNGNFKKFPVTGTSFKLSRGHFNALMKYLHHIDRQIRISQTNAKFQGETATGDFKKII
jgi:hypothetical protein